jgi:hypothetical protein
MFILLWLSEEFSALVCSHRFLFWHLVGWIHQFDKMLFSPYPAIDMHIQRHQHTLRCTLGEYLYPGRVILLIQKGHYSADQLYRCFIESAAKRDRPVSIYLSLYPEAKIIVQVFRCLSHQVGVLEIPVQGCLPRATMHGQVILGIEPLIQGIVELLKG